MKVFLSWSGERSKKIASALNAWLPKLINAVEPWVSLDIEKGARWGPEISDQLEDSRIGIICLTKENLDEKWILFEAGALSKTKDTHVCTFLLDLKSTDVEQPLAQFQYTQFEKEDFRKLVHTINMKVKKQGERSLSEKDLNELFDILWSHLEEELQKIAELQPKDNMPIRTEREILELVRGLEMSKNEDIDWGIGKLHEKGLYFILPGTEYRLEGENGDLRSIIGSMNKGKLATEYDVLKIFQEKIQKETERTKKRKEGGLQDAP